MNKSDFKSSLQFTNTDITSQQKEINNYFAELNDQYLKANSLEVKEYCSYLIAAIFLTYKRMYPDLSIYIPFRIKSDNSSIKNYSKELNKSIMEKYDPQKNELDLSGISKDFIAATVVLDHVKTSRKTKTEYLSPEISRLRKLKEDILNFVNKTDDILENELIDEKNIWI